MWAFGSFVHAGRYGLTGQWQSRLPVLEILGISVVLL